MSSPLLKHRYAGPVMSETGNDAEVSVSQSMLSRPHALCTREGIGLQCMEREPGTATCTYREAAGKSGAPRSLSSTYS